MYILKDMWHWLSPSELEEEVTLTGVHRGTCAESQTRKSSASRSPRLLSRDVTEVKGSILGHSGAVLPSYCIIKWYTLACTHKGFVHIAGAAHKHKRLSCSLSAAHAYLRHRATRPGNDKGGGPAGDAGSWQEATGSWPVLDLAPDLENDGEWKAKLLIKEMNQIWVLGQLERVGTLIKGLESSKWKFKVIHDDWVMNY